jgi:hypothetical protein
MTLKRMMLLFLGALAIMFPIVILRAETTRVHYEISALDRRDDVLRQELRREQLALQRARNPTALLERVKDMRLGEDSKPPPRKSPSRSTKP